MKVVKKILKWIAYSIGSFLVFIILAGLIIRLSSTQSPVPGKLVSVGNFKLHINAAGVKSHKPTLIIEGGGGLSTEFYHWLNEDLKDSMRVVRYDRAGLGHSDECSTPRDPETIARELHTLLKNAGESPPYIMMGHSLGGPYIRVFTQLYPEEVQGMFFLDATHHDHVERYNAPKQSSLKYQVLIRLIGFEAFIADLGILSLFDRVFGTPYYGEGLPDEINQRIKGFLIDGKSFRTYKAEIEEYYTALKRSAEADDFGALPIRVFTATHISPKKAKAQKSKPSPKGEKKYLEFEDLSTDGTHTKIPGNHVTIFSKKENAAIISEEVIQLMKVLNY